MRYISTRPGGEGAVSSAQAIYQGLSVSGGLFVPESFPALSLDGIKAMSSLSYPERASSILGGYLTDYTEAELGDYACAAYSGARFDSQGCAPLRALDASTWCMELWHGPTCAFKDMALQILPRLLTGAMGKVGDGGEVAVLVATSGDTGKAALEGFADVPGTHIGVFYPDGGVSQVQKAQMVTQRGGNVHVEAVRGNFDDTQTGVKGILADAGLARRAKAKGLTLSSANSINWGRLVPQIVYYVSAYADLLRSGEVQAGERINFVVPTGNFGNILAGYYAYRMGLPIGRLVCASNENNVLADFFASGTYDRMRDFRRTSSPSMDILISSNLERLLFEVSGRDAAEVGAWMSQLSAEGRYAIRPEALTTGEASLFWADWASEAETAGEVGRMWSSQRYLIDTHTAVAFDVLAKYRAKTGDSTKAVVVSTASPFKFPADVAGAVMGTEAVQGRSEYELLHLLSESTGSGVPEGLRGLEDLPVRYTSLCTTEDMGPRVAAWLGI